MQKPPLCNYSGALQELSSTDSVPAPGALVELHNCWTVIDDDVADTLISATSKPGSPQYTRTIVSGDFPSNVNVSDYMLLLTIGGKNTDTATRTVTYTITINGTELSSGGTTRSPTTGSPFWNVMGAYCSAALAAGDVIGVKMWADVTNKVDYRYVNIYIVPRTLAIPTANMAAHYTGVTDAATGAISGVSYTSTIASGTPCGLIDTGVQAGPLATTLGVGQMVLYPQAIATVNAFADTNFLNGGLFSSANLLKAGVPRYFRTY